MRKSQRRARARRKRRQRQRRIEEADRERALVTLAQLGVDTPEQHHSSEAP